jgi:hypothetical protein
MTVRLLLRVPLFQTVNHVFCTKSFQLEMHGGDETWMV